MRFNWENSTNEIRELRTHNTKDFPHPTEVGKFIRIQSGGLLHAFTDKGFQDIETELPDYNFPEGIELKAGQLSHFALKLPDWGEVKVEDDGKVVRVFDKKGVSIFRYTNALLVEKGKAPFQVVDKDGKKVKDSFDDKERVDFEQKIIKSPDAIDTTFEVIGKDLYIKVPDSLKGKDLQAYDATDTASTNNKDAILDAGYSNTNYGTLIALAARWLTGVSTYHSIIHFTLSAGSGVISAIKLYLYKYNDLDACSAVEIHQLTQTGWTEAGVTWNKYNGTNNWTTAGGDYSATIVDTTNNPLALGVYGWENWDLGAGATNPISGLTWGSNIHLLLRYPTGTSGDHDTLWYSKENATLKPYIQITYTLPVTTGSPICFDMAVV